VKRSLAAVVATLSLLAFSIGLSLPAASPALADDPILGTVSGVAGYVSTLYSAYNALTDYLTNPAKISDLDQIKNAITQSASQVTQQIDATVTGEAKSHCDSAIADFESITTDDQSHLATLQQEADQCVTMSMEEISAETSPQGIDGLGVALGTGGPIALATRQFEGQPTDIITTDIVNAYKALLAKPQMQPTCGITPDDNDVYNDILYPTTGPVPGTGGEAPVQGHGACFNYMAHSRVADDITYYPSGAHAGQLPWDVTGDGQVDFCAEIFTCGHSHVRWPARAQDYSVAYQQAMADTSFPVAEATLQRLLPVAGPAGQPVTMVAETATNQIYLPVDVFGVKPDGSLVQGVLNTSNDDPVGHATFGGWNSFAGPGNPVMSVASQATWDGRVQVFALDRTGLLYTRWQQNPRDDSTWSPWAQLNDHSNPLNSVSVARNSDGRLQVFGTTPSGTIVSRYQYLNTDAEFAGSYEPTASGDIHPALASWTPWQTMSVNAAMTQVTAVKVGGQISLYGVSGSGGLYERHQNAANDEDIAAAGNWSGWASVTGPSIGGNALPPRSVQAFADSDGQTNLLVTVNGSDQYQELVGTTGWVKIPGSMYGGFAVTKEPGGAGADEMFGVGQDGSVSSTYSLAIPDLVNGAWVPDTWHDWAPVGGATLRAYVPGPDAGPVLNPLQPGTGQVTLTWADMSTNEDNFAVFRYTTGGAYISEASDQSSVSKAGTGEVNTFTDTSPNPSAPCYQVDSYDFAGSFIGASDIVCPPSPTVSNPGTQFGTVGTPVSLQIQASDPNGQELRYLASGLPDGLTINRKTGLISGTPTRANPDGGGIGLDFEVTVIVTNSDGFSSTTTFGWLIGPAQLLGNRDFEDGTAPWSATPGVIDLASAAEPAAVGNYLAGLDGYGSPHTDTLSQTVTVPSGSAHYDLNFWLHIDTQELTTSVAFDHLSVQVLDQSGNVLATLATYSNLDANTGYAPRTLNMAAYAGQTVTVKFTGTEDINNKTDFVIDYTSLKVY
jgi:putative Ig domain-containing protein